MQIIIALGNPGKKYENNRHNAGWLALDYIKNDSLFKNEYDYDAESAGVEKFNSKIYNFSAGSEKNYFVYPQTFMNESGKAVQQILAFYKLMPKDILVLHDEIDLPLGTIRFTENSSSAGHNGIQSIIDALGTQEFRRIRIGVEGRETKSVPATEDYVLQNFSSEELKKIPFEQIKSRVLFELKPKNNL
jgi:PTH1 family peptidyl-tRNA hydrolase